VTALVSIVIPCYNAEAWIAQAIESSLAQTWPQKEVIVVNDGSRDGSVAVARTFEGAGVRVIDQPNRGASAARNAGLDAARGEFLQYLDADDLLAPDKIERQMRAAAESGPGVLFSGTWGRFYGQPAAATFPPQPLCLDAGPWDEHRDPDDDGEYFARVLLASRGVRFCREAVSYYRSGLTGSLSDTGSDRAWSAVYRSHGLTAERLRRAEDSPRTRHASATMFQRFIYESYPWAAECRRQAAAQVAALGGSGLEPEGGLKFQLARRFLGWRLARRLARRFSH